MAVKEEEFKSIVLAINKNNKFINDGIVTKENFLENIIDIRKLHAKYLREADDFLLSPNYEQYEAAKLVKGRGYMRDLCVDIRRICTEVGIKVIFPLIETLEFKKRIIAIYMVENTDISGLIYYNKAKIEKENIDNYNL